MGRKGDGKRERRRKRAIFRTAAIIARGRETVERRRERGERKQSRKLKSSDEMWEREEDEGRELLLPKEQPTYS